jgi:hypothetical protein
MRLWGCRAPSIAPWSPAVDICDAHTYIEGKHKHVACAYLHVCVKCIHTWVCVYVSYVYAYLFRWRVDMWSVRKKKTSRTANRRVCRYSQFQKISLCTNRWGFIFESFLPCKIATLLLSPLNVGAHVRAPVSE